MFGYVKTDNPNMYVKDTVLYNALYCSLCKGIGRVCGAKGRLVLNYDLTFLSALLHNIMGIDVTIKKEHCIGHWFDKKPCASIDKLTETIGALNVILAYHKCNDDVVDKNNGKIKRAFFKGPYKKAKKQYPKLDEIVTYYYQKLLKLERRNIDSIDIISDPFGLMMEELVGEIAKEFVTHELKRFSYNLGKWIYLIDAVDDFDKDLKKNNYNVFRFIYKDCSSKKEMVEKNAKELKVIFNTILSDIIENSKAFDYKFNHDLTDNIINKGLKMQTAKIVGEY